MVRRSHWFVARPVRAALFAALATSLSACVAYSRENSPIPRSGLIKESASIPSKVGKPLEVSCEEKNRSDAMSIVALEFKSGASVASSMFYARCFYLIAKDRGKAYFTSFEAGVDADGRRLHKAVFSNSRNFNPRALSGDPDLPESVEPAAVMSVILLDTFWASGLPVTGN